MRIQAIVLKNVEIREHDKMIICYTQQAGKQAYMAKSVSRSGSRQQAHLEPLNWIDFSAVESARMPIIASATSLTTFSKLKGSLPALAVAHFMCECFDKIVYDGQPDADLWRFLTATLADLEERSFDVRSDWRSVLSGTYEELMKVMGYGGDTSLIELHHSRLHSLSFFNEVMNGKA